MIKQEQREYLEQRLQKARIACYSISRDFAGDYADINNTCYLCDCIGEYADSQVDIYTGNLLEWFKEHFIEVENAIDEFGDIARDSNGRADITATIQRGQYLYYEQKMYEDIEEILTILACRYLLDNADTIEVKDNLSNVDLDCMLDDVRELGTSCQFCNILDNVEDWVL